MNIKWVGAHSNNYQVGRAGEDIKFIVAHWVVGTLESADSTFANPQRIASATYGVGDFDIHQYVKETDTAYANGNLSSNRRSISIEHEGGPNLPITTATYETSARLIADIAKRYSISLDRNHIKKHNEVSDKPTQCPGTLDIDWLINRAKEINGENKPFWNDQTKIPLNFKSALEEYKEVELGTLRSQLSAKDQSLKDLTSANKQQSVVLSEYQKQAEYLNTDIDQLKNDLAKYKNQQNNIPTKPVKVIKLGGYILQIFKG